METEDPVVYVERSQSDSLKLKHLEGDREYYPCDRNDSQGVYINDYDYYFIRRDRDVCVYIEETVAPKYWSHDYISPKLYIECIRKAAVSHNKVEEVHGSSHEPEYMRVLYEVMTCENCSGEESVNSIIKEVDKIIDEIRSEAEVIAKRELIRYINK